MTSTRQTAAVLAVLITGALALHAQGEAASGSVTVSFMLMRSRQIASDQLAVWIENGNGTFVRTLYVSDFAGRRAGWKLRPATAPTWVSVADVKNTPQRDIDAVSGATPSTGPVSVVWDLKDAKGKPVPRGIYRYRIEANISWANTVLWTGLIDVGETGASGPATAVYSPTEAEKVGTPISAVSAVHKSGKR